MRIVSLTAKVWTLPLVAPFTIAARTAYEAQNVLVCVETEGPTVSGYGESAPVFYVTGETVETTLAVIGAAANHFVGMDCAALGPLWDKASELLPQHPAARAGLEMALADIWGKRWSLPLFQYFGGRQETLTTDMTIPLVTPHEAARLAAAAWEEGFRCLKIKVGDAGGHEADFERLASIAQAAPGMHLRIDANQAFEPDTAVEFTRRLIATGAQIELLEQPVAKEDWQGLKWVKEHVDVPVFADEAARDPDSVAHLIQHDAADGINIKLMKSGLAGALEIIRLCRAAGKKLMLGCMLESSLGIAAAAQIAGGTGAFDYLDLDSHRLLLPVAGLTGGFTCDGDRICLGKENNASGWGVSVPTGQGNNLTGQSD